MDLEVRQKLTSNNPRLWLMMISKKIHVYGSENPSEIIFKKSGGHPKNVRLWFRLIFKKSKKFTFIVLEVLKKYRKNSCLWFWRFFKKYLQKIHVYSSRGPSRNPSLWLQISLKNRSLQLWSSSGCPSIIIFKQPTVMALKVLKNIFNKSTFCF